MEAEVDRIWEEAARRRTKPRKRTRRTKHPLGRPGPGQKILRLTEDNEWIKDDGEPGRAFSGQDGRYFPIAWGPDCDCFPDDEASCPHRLAMQKTCDRFGAANGHSFAKDPRGTK